MMDRNYIGTFKSDYALYSIVENIWYYDGSLLDHMVDPYHNNVLILFNGLVEGNNSWIVSILKQGEIEKFKSQEVDLRDTMVNAVCSIYYELDRNIDVLNEREVNIIDHPEYFPESGCYYD